MSDLIDRQAAIDALRKMQTYKLFSGDDMLLIDQAGAQTELMMLPPAQLSTNLAEVGTDCISRQALLDKFEPWLKVKDYNDGELNMLKAVLYEIRFMRPARPEPSQVAKDIARIVENGQDMRVIGQPERIKGHWVNGRCDKCNAHAPFWCMASTYHESNFCSNCGADMRER